MKFNDAIKELESQTLKVGIGFLLSGKKLTDFGKLFIGKLKDYMLDGVSEEEAKKKYLEAKELFEAPAVKKMEAARKLMEHDVDLLLRQPDVDELMTLSGSQKELPDIGLPLDVLAIAEMAMKYVGDAPTNAEKVESSLKVLEKCLMDSTFEAPKPTNGQIMEMIRANSKLATGIIELFIGSLGN